MSDKDEINGHDESLEHLEVHNLHICESSESRTPSIKAWTCKSNSPLEILMADTPISQFQRDLMDAFEVSDVWLSEFGNDKESAQLKWKEYLAHAFEKYEHFMKHMNEIENDVNEKIECDGFLDISSIIEKKRKIEALYVRVEEPDEEYTDAIKCLSKLPHYFPKGMHREKTEELIRKVRCRNFDMLELLHRRKLIFCRVIQFLQKYKSNGSELKVTLDTLESRYQVFISNLNNSEEMLPCEETINEIVVDIKVKKNIMDSFASCGHGIIDLDHQLQIDELRQDMEDVIQRWDKLCMNIEKSLRHIQMEKNFAALVKKSDEEKIDFKIQDEFHMCTCSTPFQIIKVADGKYTFGLSKTVRLLRINGSSIVIRVGGGWEYLYDFLLKVDPCRAQQLATGAKNKSMQCSGVTFTSLDEKNADFTMSVKRMNRSSWIPSRFLTRKVDLSDSQKKLHQLNECDESLDSTDSSTTPLHTKGVQKGRCRSRGDTLPKSNEKTYFTPRTRRSLDCSLYMSTDNINRKKTDTRRLSLVDRQKLYAEKRMRSTDNLNL